MAASHQEHNMSRNGKNWERLLSVGDILFIKGKLYAISYHKKFLAGCPSIVDPQDLLMEAIAALGSGKRVMPDDLEVMVIVKNVIRSIASNYAKRRNTEVEYAAMKRLYTRFSINRDEHKAEIRIDYESLKASLSEEPLLVKLLELLWEDPEIKPRDIAQVLKIPVKDIHPALKRLRKKVKEFTKASEL